MLYLLKNGSLKTNLPNHYEAASGEAHQPTEVSWAVFSLVQKNPENTWRNGAHHTWVLHTILPVIFKNKKEETYTTEI